MSGDNATTSPVVNEDAASRASANGNPDASAGHSEGEASQTQPQGDAVAQRSKLDELRERLTGQPAQEPPPATADDAPKPGEDTPAADEVPAPESPQATKDDETPPANTDDDPERLSDDEWKALSGKTRARIVGQGRKIKAQAARIAELEKEADPALIGNGKYIDQFMQRFGLSPEQMHGSMQLLAGYLAADAGALPGLVDAVQKLARATGQPDPTAATSASPADIAPYEGRLGQKYQELIDVNGFAEEDVRRFAALTRANAAAPASRTPARQPAAPPAPPAAPAIPAPDPARRAAPQADVTSEVDRRLAAQAGKAVASFLASKGVKDVQAHVNDHLWKYLAEAAPEGNPLAIPSERRLKAVEVAHQRWLIDQASARKTTGKRPGVIGSTGSGAPPRSPEPKPATGLAALRAKMVQASPKP